MVIETEVVLISVVTPLFNEEDNIKKFYHRTSEVLTSLNKSYEIIFIDDGSKDRTYDIIKNIQIENTRVRIIKFKKNRGQLYAFLAGFEVARGEIIITMDGDLQNDPRDIPKFLDKIEKGFDFVNGWRYKRKDSLERRLISKVSNWLTRKRTKVSLRDYGCAFMAVERRLIDRLRKQGVKARF
nr:glycosyltransferase family 2 protein [Candidatus Omnitrophota bacterium]